MKRYYNSKQSRKIFLFLAFATMTVVLGLRGSSVGEDTQHYIDVFDRAARISWDDMFQSIRLRTVYYVDEYGYADTIEDGFLVLCKIVHLFTHNPQVFLFLVAAVSLFFYAKFIHDNTDDVYFATYIFLTESLFMLSFNGIRQLLAGAIALQAYTVLKKKQLGKALLFIVGAALIHNVAIITMVIIPLFYIKEKQETDKFKYAMLITILSPFIVMVMGGIIAKIFPRYAAYFSTNFWMNSIGGTAILWILEFGIIFYLYKKKFPREQLFRLSSYVLIYLVFELTGLRITMFSRVAWFFRPYLMILIPEGVLCFKGTYRKWIKILLCVLMLLLYLSYAKTPSRYYVFCW